MKKGFLISIEGIDGSGKSTLARNLAHLLQKHNHEIFLTKEPGGSPLGQKLRDILHEQKEIVCDTAEYLLFAADRAQHFYSIIKPALAQGKIVISDRLHDSSLAYQGYGRGIDRNMITSINKWVMDGIAPDLTLHVKIDVATAVARIKQSRHLLTSFEQEKQDFWQRVSDGFDTIFANRENVIKLDGSLDAETLAEQATKNILDFFRK